MSKEYNGHPSRQFWNVALWINNDEPQYRLALECLKNSQNVRVAAREFIRRNAFATTPDGARYTVAAVAHTLKGLKEP